MPSRRGPRNLPVFLSLFVPIAAFSDDTPRLAFRDVTSAAGIEFTHESGASGRRYLVETFGGGVLVLDYDGDGWPDIYFVNGGRLPGSLETESGNVLYRNRGDGTFVDVTLAAGASGNGYHFGGAAADLDNDGDVDIYVTSFGPDLLYRNNGDGTFTETASQVGLHNDRWSSCATFLDVDADGSLDLYVCNYLDFSLDTHKVCTDPTKGIEAYCHPREFGGTSDVLYRNASRGFEDITRAAGVANPREGKGLGVAAADYDGDGDLDLYVANDSTRNFLYRNARGERFEDIGFESGVGFNEEGSAEAGMGTDWGDVDRDGFLDLVVTNFDFETNTLYRNLGRGYFVDLTARAGLGEPSLTKLGFGCDFADFDNDGWLDLVVTNGHILDNIAQIHANMTHAQPGQFFWNTGGRFRDVSTMVGPALSKHRVGRGLASLDFDRDGDLDLVLANNGGPAELLQNEGGDEKSWLGLRLVGTRSNRDALGARIRAHIAGLPLVTELRAASSYLSQNELTLYVGLDDTEVLDELTIRWPSGREEILGPLASRAVYVVKEGVSVLGRQ